MKKSTAFLLICIFINLCCTQLFAQWRLKTDLTTGYEHNIYRNPSRLIVNQTDTLGKPDLLNNSAYTEVFIRFAYQKKIDQENFKFKANISSSHYYNEPDADAYSFEFIGDYRLKLGKGKYVEINPTFFRRFRKAEIESLDAILRTPYAFSQVDIPLSLDFYLKKNSWFKINPLYVYRHYDQTSFSNRLRFHAWMLQALYKKRWINPETEHKIELSGTIGTRYYRDRPEVSSENNPIDEILLGERRLWNYYIFQASYTAEFYEGRIALSFPLEYTSRNDKIPNNFSFTEQSIGAELKLKDENFLLVPSLRYTRRNYGQILGDNQELLQYNILFGRIYYKKRITPFLEGIFKADLNLRLSNRGRLDTRYFRGYTNYLIEAGIIYELR